MYDPVQTVLAALGVYLFYPVLQGEGLKNYELFGNVQKKLYATVEMAVGDFVGQWISYGPGKLLSGSREPVSALSTGVIFGIERKAFHKKKSFFKSFIGGTAVDSVAIVLTEPLNRIVKPNNVKVRSSGASYTRINDDSIGVVLSGAKPNNQSVLKPNQRMPRHRMSKK